MKLAQTPWWKNVLGCDKVCKYKDDILDDTAFYFKFLLKAIGNIFYRFIYDVWNLDIGKKLKIKVWKTFESSRLIPGSLLSQDWNFGEWNSWYAGYKFLVTKNEYFHAKNAMCLK